jgi:hypothetical protein
MEARTVEKPPRAHRGRPLTAEHKARIAAGQRASAARRAALSPTAAAGVMPAVRLRLSLTAARRAGATFEEARPEAVRAAVAGTASARKDWIEVLNATRDAWERAFRRDGEQACWSALETAQI